MFANLRCIYKDMRDLVTEQMSTLEHRVSTAFYR